MDSLDSQKQQKITLDQIDSSSDCSVYKMKFKDEQMARELMLNDERVLKVRKEEFSKSLINKIDLMCYLVLLLLYLQDSSTLLLLLRSFHQFMLGHPPNSAESLEAMTISAKKVVAHKVLGFSIAINLGAMIVHLLLLAGSDLGEGYSYGSLNINIIGERRFEGFFGKLIHLLVLDLLLVALQFVLYSINFLIEQRLLVESTDADVDAGNSELPELAKSYDGYQGEVVIHRFDILQIVQKARSFNLTNIISEDSAVEDSQPTPANGNPTRNVMQSGLNQLRGLTEGNLWAEP